MTANARFWPISDIVPGWFRTRKWLGWRLSAKSGHRIRLGYLHEAMRFELVTDH
jgi:hypothetical protein